MEGFRAKVCYIIHKHAAWRVYISFCPARDKMHRYFPSAQHEGCISYKPECEARGFIWNISWELSVYVLYTSVGYCQSFAGLSQSLGNIAKEYIIYIYSCTSIFCVTLEIFSGTRIAERLWLNIHVQSQGNNFFVWDIKPVAVFLYCSMCLKTFQLIVAPCLLAA